MKWRVDKGQISSKERTEEINDIIDRMPVKFGLWVALAVIIFAVLLLTFGWFIKYPDIVVGRIKINSDNASVKLVANSSGAVKIFFKPQQLIKKDDYIAVIQNSAHTEDVVRISRIISSVASASIESIYSIKDSLPQQASLGELSLKYYYFLSSLKNKYAYDLDNIYEKQRISINDDSEWRKQLLKESGKSLQIARERLEISEKWENKYSSLNQQEVITYEFELDKIRTEKLAIVQEVQNLNKEITSIEMQIIENNNKLAQLAVEQSERERTQEMDLISSFQDLFDNIALWEQKYVFKSPFDGTLEYLSFWANDQFVMAGDEVFAVVPSGGSILGQVLLPADGAGKVKISSPVTVKLDNYPYMEYGIIEGYVSSISLLSQSQIISQNTVDTYLVTVELPLGLKTNYAKILDFKHEIAGTADIIVNDRRLIERLFDNLKYRIN